MLDGGVVSEESRPLAAGVGDQRLLPVEFQPEGFPEEFGYPGLDFFGTSPRDSPPTPARKTLAILTAPGMRYPGQRTFSAECRRLTALRRPP
jgi:hypothetical protein